MIVFLFNSDAPARATRTDVVNIFAGYIEILYPFDGDLRLIKCGAAPRLWGGVDANCSIYADDEAYLIEDNAPDTVWFEDSYRLAED